MKGQGKRQKKQWTAETGVFVTRDEQDTRRKKETKRRGGVRGKIKPHLSGRKKNRGNRCREKKNKGKKGKTLNYRVEGRTEKKLVCCATAGGGYTGGESVEAKKGHQKKRCG